MRKLPYIQELWERGGPFIGKDKPNHFVTVDDDWWLAKEANPGRMKANRLPVRWWQRADNSQVEREIPGIKNISINRGLTSDAGECTITLTNLLPKYDNLPDDTALIEEWGEKGGFTLNHGQDPDAVARWGHTKNSWFRVLRPGALIRTYQGYGGWADPSTGTPKKTREQCIEDGHTPITGVWRVDTVAPNANGDLVLECRDMAGILIDQMIYPPLVPKGCYPLHFWRWTYATRTIVNPPAPAKLVKRRLRYVDSSADRWYGSNAQVHGHRGSDSIDGNDSTFALSVGNSHPSRPFCTDWWEYVPDGQINSFTMKPWMGGYTMYVSVMVGGRWLGAETVPYDSSPLVGRQETVVDTDAGIPYVAQFHVPWEKSQRYKLPALYKAERLRITFRNHTRSQWGHWYYRAGIREISAEAYDAKPAPTWVGFAGHTDGYGYWGMSDRGVIQAFGDAINHQNYDTGKSITAKQLAQANSNIVAFDRNTDGGGILALTHSGWVFPLGGVTTENGYGPGGPALAGVMDAGPDAVDICEWRDGPGYWVLRRNGQIHAYNGPPSYAFVTPGHGGVVAGASHPTGTGVYVLYRDGTVAVRGDAVHLGDGPAGDYVDITPVHDADGYYLTKSDGAIVRIGDGAVDLGVINEPAIRADNTGYFGQAVGTAIGPTISGVPTGLTTLYSTGWIATRGDAPNLGSPAGNAAQVRRPGNYRDLTDIVKLLLLWSGFWLKGGNSSTQEPKVFGNLESTGFAPEAPFNEDFFDKKPVMNVINQIKEITGYCFWIDQEGAVQYGSPNFWESGNFLLDGTHVDELLEIDEKHNLTGFTARQTLKHERSEVAVSDGEPNAGIPGVRSEKWTQPGQVPENKIDYLRGLSVPAAVAVPVAIPAREMKLMAQLIALQINYKRRSASASCAAHPGIDINDQVRIFERTASEVFVNYVTSVSTEQNVLEGTYTMSLQTYWLGSGTTAWALETTADGRVTRRLKNPEAFGVSEEARSFATSRIRRQDSEDLSTQPLPDIDQIIDPETDGVGPA